MTTLPQVLWAQRRDRLFLTVNVPDAQDPQVSLSPEGKLTFHAKSGSKEYDLTLNLMGEIVVEESKWSATGRNVAFVIKKKEAGHWDRLVKESGKHAHIACDWDRWVDEDEEDDSMDFGNMDDFNGFGGFPGGDMRGFDDEEEDSDDDALPDLEYDAEKSAESAEGSS
eukprot:GILI01004886.1.p1 GENE.GILI01004886.1~~GILI01004886.1.p1  ORF type:complete len:168 (+),score=57.78 GILI01004886.1:76-579(+)